MKYVNIISQLFAIIFLGFLIWATVQAEHYGFACGLGVIFLLVLKFNHIDKFKISKDSIEVEDKDEPKN